MPGQGYARSAAKGVRRIVVSFDEETFEQIRVRALAAKSSFASSVRELVEWGLMEVQSEEG